MTEPETSMNNAWQVGDYIRITYKGDEQGWGRLEHEVTEADVPLANGAEPGDFLWRAMGSYMRDIHEQPLTRAELAEETRQPQDRLLWCEFPYDRKSMVVLDDLQYVALHGALKLHERAIRIYDQEALTLKNTVEEAERAHAERQAKKEAAKRLGGRDNTAERRTTKKEALAEARCEMAAQVVEGLRFEAALIIACQARGDQSYWDVASPSWHALERHPNWRALYTLATDHGLAPLPERRRTRYEAEIVERLAQERSYNLKTALKPPAPPRKRCECCGQLERESRLVIAFDSATP